VTNRELEVLRCLCDGLSTKEMMVRLGVAEGTIRVHLNNLYKKLSVRSRHQLVALVLNGKVSLNTDPNQITIRSTR
jgi:two-component system, NarL family, nitrate/nitrite response regulator NarL